MNEIDRFEIRCRLLPHIVMSPGAMLVTGVTIEQATDPNLPSHYEMVRAIRAKLLEWSPSIFVGYNSMAFDEELIRQAQYQTLHNPYLTNRDGNTRADAMMLVKAVAQFEPGCLSIPLKPNGKASFKLDQVAPANGFDHSNAHDAMADVAAVIHLCKIIAEEASTEWSNFIRFSQKASAEAFLLDGDAILVTEFFTFGGHKHFPIVCIGVDGENSNKHLCFDLSHDPQDFRSMSHDALMACITSGPKPLRKIKINAAPTLRAIDEAPASCLGGLSEVEIASRAADVLSDTALITRLLTAYEGCKKIYDESPHIEQRIYGGFALPADEQLMELFHQTPWPERHTLVPQFTDERFAFLASRVIYAEHPNYLPDSLRQEIRAHIGGRLSFDGKCDWGTIPKGLAECAQLLVEVTAEKAAMLTSYHQHLVERLAALELAT